ncbi:MAG: zinc dependent phospholipase C family protein [Desulfobacterales bacterium]|nr:zinc dependent phospholipase C family protein [Desulfobacterales bacterium]
MPKEITHFALARQLQYRLTPASPFYKPVHSYPRLFRLGAIAPDIPFFYLAGPHKDDIRHISRYYHRTDGEALRPLLKFLDTHNTPAALALAAGVVCHLVSDTVFHPMVFYFAGMDGVHSGATGRHRQFETAMDLHFYHLYNEDPYVYRLVSSVEIPRPELNGLLAGLFSHGQELSGELPRAISGSLNWFMGMQFLFRNTLIRQVATLCERSYHPLPEEASGVIYPFPGPVALPFFKGRLRYRDPINGDRITTSLTDLVKKTVDSSLGLLDHISMAGGAGRQLGDMPVNRDGQPLVLPDLPPDRIRYWRGKTALTADLYHGVLRRPRF